VKETWNIVADQGAVVLREGVAEDGTPAARNGFVVRDWPRSAPLSAALSGSSVSFELVHPMTAGESATPQVVLNSNASGRLWAERDPFGSGDLTASTPEAEELIQSSVAMVTIDGGSDAGRAVIVADDLWLTDALIQARQSIGNLELMSTASLWAADLDAAVAESARAGMVRRIGEVSPAARAGLRWALLVGLPALILITGGIVGLRRRG
jgi:hypothetical protein